MNDIDIDRVLRDYYKSIAPADSTRATTLVAAAIRARRERSAARDTSVHPRTYLAVAAALIVAIVAGACFAVWRAGSGGGAPVAAPGTATITASGVEPSTNAIEPVASAGAGQSPTARPSPTLRAATKWTPSGGFSPTGSMDGQYDTATLLLDGRVLMTGDHAKQMIGNLGVNVWTASAELYDAATGTFAPTGSMVQARGDGTATRLQDGRVLLAGGVNYSSNAGQLVTSEYAAAELFDPNTGRFSPTGSMDSAREGQTATLLGDGEVLIAGGSDLSGSLSTAELYDSKTGTFRSTGDMTTPRKWAKATLLSDGRVLVAGGFSGSIPVASAELYDPTAGTFSPTGSMTTLRMPDSYTATLLQDGRVLIVGGQSYGTATLATSELYDPTTGTFRPTGSMATARGAHTATLLYDGRVLIEGGVSSPGVGYVQPKFAAVEVEAAPLPGRFAMVSLDLGGPRAVSTGGPSIVGATGPSAWLTSAELYDPSTGRFSPTGAMGTARADATATMLLDGRVLVAGGDSAVGASAELYQP